MPGHVLPLMALSGGVMMRLGRAEGAVDLMRAAGMRPCAATVFDICARTATPRAWRELREFAAAHDLPILFVKDLVSYRLTNELLVQRVGERRLSDRFRRTQAIVFRSTSMAASIWRWSRATSAADGRRWCGFIRNA